ncbi:FAD-dependent oxidoreductase [Acetobacterium carbinolicum]|jgi:2,4-dienoyl-CoA reductase-like NADH-dependent reductase (Old Yellow Enzyme family)/thioredoxin reductase|uniref:FAD-dependent oxidoreductase n=1 Tax=Acetobacterium TaxID=33951 RepID=UPI000DBEBF8C|nr:FAD-dependent oxidoreductase [Acetobacterium sp. KB-1]AWW26928.1 NADH:flavin oxidoreductase [Acetobacterium sp. KB-1]
MYEKLFLEGTIGKLKLKNRLVMSPMGIGLAELDGSPTQEMIAFYEARAIGGAGLIIPEITRVNDVHGAGMLRQLSVTKDRHIEPLSRLAQAVHKHGTKIFIQLHHPGRETMTSLVGGPVAAPSAIPCNFLKQPTRALEHAEIKELVQQFVAGAVRVQKAGCDGVELHAAHGYLINQFLSPYTNKRDDEYGGSFENRLRFIAEIIAGIRNECGPDFPISVRLSVEEFLSNVGVTDDYIHIQDGVKISMALEKLGIDVINVSCGIYETGSVCVEPVSFPQGWRRDLIKAVKDHVAIPVIAVSVFREPAVGEQFLADGIVDFVALGRAWLADEEWGLKVKEGREKQLCKCISCLRCFESLNENNAVGLPLVCSVNPRLAREQQLGNLAHDSFDHKVAVIGGGAAGMSAARTLALRGIHVTLFEKENTLGGLINIAKMPPHKGAMDWICQYYQNEFDRLNVAVKLNTEATLSVLEEMAPDAVILATGSTPVVPRRIPGVDGENVFGIDRVLSGATGLKDKQVVLIGAGMSGIETAEYLCAAGNSLTIVDMLNKVAPDGNGTNVLDVTGRLAKYGATYMLSHALKEITPDGVILEKMEDHSEIKIPADAVVLSMGYCSNNSLAEELKKKFERVEIIGDALKVDRIEPAIRAGFEAGRCLFIDKPKATSFLTPKEDLENFGKLSLMDNQEGLYLCFLTDPAVIARLLPPPLKPFSMPVVTLSIAHIHNPSFADDYYEAILGVYAMYGKELGLYPLSLVLGGPGAEMAVQLGRDNGSIPKKMGAEFVIRQTGNTVMASVTRRGVQLIEAKLELGETNSPLTGAMYQFPEAGKQTYGGGFYFHFDREPDKEGVSHFTNGALLQNLCEYTYKSWEPGFASLKLRSSIDDPWGELPINTIVGGAYSVNSLLVHKLNLVENLNAEDIVPYLMAGRYDRTAFMETGRK